MKVIVWSKNPIKVDAVAELIVDYPLFCNAEVAGIDVQTWVADQPQSLRETIEWAITRAKNSYLDCDYGFWIEDGLVDVPHSKTGQMNMCVCSIYDWKNIHLGISSAFEYPVKVMKLVKNKGLDITQAFYKTWLSNSLTLWAEEGAIGLLTKWRLIRKNMSKQAIQMALIHLENKELY